MRRFWLGVALSTSLSCGRSRPVFDELCRAEDRFAAAVESWDTERIGGGQGAQFEDPQAALGPPDYSGGALGTGAVALGQGGFIVLGFEGCTLANDGSDAPDLEIFEVGPYVEISWISMRPVGRSIDLFEPEELDPEGFVLLGSIGGSRTTIDIDTVRPDSYAGELEFDAIRIVDDPTQSGAGGADIDAVELLSHAPG